MTLDSFCPCSGSCDGVVAGYQLIPDTDFTGYSYVGYDLFGTTSGTVTSCAAQCNANSACIAFVNFGNTCFFKGFIGTPVPTVGLNAYVQCGGEKS